MAVGDEFFARIRDLGQQANEPRPFCQWQGF